MIGNDALDIDGQVAMVTGAGKGAGRGIALELARHNAGGVAVNDFVAERAEEVVAEIRAMGVAAVAVPFDVCDLDAVRAAFAKVEQEIAPVTILVNNAGMAPFTPYMQIDEALWDKVIAVNLKGPHLCIREMLPAMLEAGWGRVINITSSSTQSGSPAQGHYVASKGGLLGLTKALALEYAPSGVTFNMVPPGFIDTPMLRASPIDVDAFAQSTPMKRPGRPEEMAAACAFLASDDASYITGQTISVNGGRYMGSA